MDKANKAAGADQPAEPQGIFTPREEPVEVSEVAPVLRPQELRSNITTATGKGDIKLSGQKKSKKGVVIGLVIVVICVFVGLAAFLILRNTISDSGTSTLADAKNKFSQYATYLLYGEVRNELTGSYEVGQAYELDKQFESSAYNALYWDRAKELLSGAVLALSSVDNGSSLQSVLSGYQNEFLFLSDWVRLGELSTDSLLSKYYSSGIDSTKQSIQDHYATLLESPNSNLSDLANQKITQLQYYAETLEYYIRSGCIVNQDINEVCIENLTPDTDTKNIIDDENRLRVEINYRIQSLINNLESNCWILDKAFLDTSASTGTDNNSEDQ